MSLFQRVKQNVMERSRAAKLEHFYRYCGGSDTVLDVGVSSGSVPLTNYFLSHFRLPGEQYTGLGIQDLSGVRAAHPGKRFVEYPGGRFPFADGEFDCVFSNAVIEHVGDFPQQVEFLNEMIRVGRTVFFTTPHKYFPVESHTNLLFLHWFDGPFYRWLSRHRPHMDRSNLQLFSRRHLLEVLKASNASGYELTENRVLGMTMTFTVVIQEGAAPSVAAARPETSAA